jgi:predicted ATPase
LVDSGDLTLDYRDDLRATGQLLFWLATGQRTRLGDSTTPAAATWASDTIASLPESFLGVITRLLAVCPRHGYRHARALLDDLVRCRSGNAPVQLGPLGVPPDLWLPLTRFGRDQEVATLVSAYLDTTERRLATADFAAVGNELLPRTQGQSVMLLVDGLSGIGKSSVIAAACQSMARHGARIAFGKFNQFGDSRPYWALTQALDGVIAGVLSDEPARRILMIERLQEALLDLAKVLFDFIPRLERLLGPQPEPPVLSGEASRVRFVLLMRRFIAALAMGDEPLVLVMDDLHWADSATLDLMRGFLRDPSIQHLLLVGAYRSEAVSEGHPVLEMIQETVTTRRDLRRLTVHAWQHQDVVNLLQATGIDPDRQSEALSHLLMATTGGNPFAVFQSLREVYDLGALDFVAESGAWRVNSRVAVVALRGVQTVDLVGRQLSRLPLASQEIVSTGAYLGASFDLEALAAAAKLSAEQTLAALWPALARGLLTMVEEKAAPASVVAVRMAHDIVQQAAHARIDAAQSARRHGRPTVQQRGAQCRRCHRRQ